MEEEVGAVKLRPNLKVKVGEPLLQTRKEVEVGGPKPRHHLPAPAF